MTKLVLFVLLAVAALYAASVACSEPTPTSVPMETKEPRPTASPAPTAGSSEEAPAIVIVAPTQASEAPTSLPDTPTAVATPTIEASSEPSLQDYVLETVEPARTTCSPPDPDVIATPSPTPLALSDDMDDESTDVVQVDFPAWVDDCPQMAYQIASADAIIRATFVSLDSEIVAEANESLGYSVDLIYTFVTEEYLKGDGPEEIAIRANSGPAYNAFPDWFGYRSHEDAENLADFLLWQKLAVAQDNADAILFLGEVSDEADYTFIGLESWRGERESPDIGTTWLGIDEGSGYRHTFMGGRLESITEEELRFRIEDLRPLLEGEYGACAGGALYQRAQVREHVLGTLRQLTLGGYGDPWPFPMFAKTVSQGEALFNVFKAVRPAYPTPRFSHYWFDGEFRNRFAAYMNFDFDNSLESFHATYVLPPGQYSVYYSQFHQSLPCDAPYSSSNERWFSTDTAEWVIAITEATEE